MESGCETSSSFSVPQLRSISFLYAVLSPPDTIAKLAIAHRQAFAMSNRSIPLRPSTKTKPPNLQITMLDHSDQDYLNENLLGDGDSVSPTTRRSADLPGQFDSHGQGPYRLVVAIDYGTTFTGEQTSLSKFWGLADERKRCRLCHS